MTTLSELEKRLVVIEARNKRVEADKAWETSLARKILISILTYTFIAMYLAYIGQSDPWINAIVPAVGFLLSTLTLSWFKYVWLRRAYKK